MQPGRKAETAGTKLARGTFKPHRDGKKTQIIVAGDPPQMPDYLAEDAEAVDVWQETIGRVMSTGIAEPDSSLLARYCAAEAQARRVFKNDGMLTAPMLTALRQMEELLGIAGPKSRIGRATDGKSSNPFARNGRR
jgi:hypothetical protein